MSENPMGKVTVYPEKFDPELLVAIPRSVNRNLLGLNDSLPFVGSDTWYAYELSWLDGQGKPRVAIARFSFSCNSPNLVESKSFKLFLNSLNQEKIANEQTLLAILNEHLSRCSGDEVEIELFELTESEKLLQRPEGHCLDELPVTTNIYQPDPTLLHCNEAKITEESLYTNLFKSNCPVTDQPDWGSIGIYYHGAAIDHAGLLKYFISYRLHTDYHENCVEKIFVDIQRHCQPEKLIVQANFLRRGGLDINPVRCSHTDLIAKPLRYIRQ
jgi:7-cyano-7-deazaguanine reductase